LANSNLSVKIWREVKPPQGKTFTFFRLVYSGQLARYKSKKILPLQIFSSKKNWQDG